MRNSGYWLRGSKGFTLIELLIVIIIIALLAAIGIPRYFDAIERARRAEAAGTMGEIRRIELLIYSDASSYDDCSAGDTIGVDLDGDTTYEAEMSLPAAGEGEFDFSVSGSTITAASNTSHIDYTMDINTGDVSP